MSPTNPKDNPQLLDLTKWAKVPHWLMFAGGIVVALGILVAPWRESFAYTYLTVYMFFLSLMLGALFLVITHHLMDTYWMVPIRRFLEHIASSVPVMAALFIPIALLARKIYPWMTVEGDDHALEVKKVLLNLPMFYLIAVVLFAIWWWLSRGLRAASLEQDRTGAPACTTRMRKLSAGGIFIFAFTLTLAAILWMQSIEYEWYSTMYGVYYFAGSVWVTLATAYVLALVLDRGGPLAPIMQKKTYHDTAVLFFAFTVFYAYIHFSQYFLIWNGNLPEETFWYVQRENGVWWDVGMLIVFGHFFVPFLALLRIDAKLSLPLMIPMCVWAWLMHFSDVAFNIMPVVNPAGEGISFSGLVWVLGSFAFIGGVFSKFFIKDFISHPPFPLKDPRIAETLEVYVPPASSVAAKAGPSRS